MMRFLMKTLSVLKSLLLNSLLLLCSVLFSLLILEQGFRLWVFGWSAFDKQAMEKNTMIGNSGLVEQSPYPEIYWALKPNLDQSFKLVRFQTNAFGMADKNYELTKSEDTFRIAVLGDSYSMAAGIDTDKSYHALLEKSLNQSPLKPVSIKEYQFLNFAIGGFNLQRYNEVLKYLVPQWQPDALLIGYCGMNDHEQIKIHHTVQPFDPFQFNGFYRSYVAMYLKDFHFKVESDVPALIDEDARIFIDEQLARIRQQADALRPGMPIILAYLDNRERHADDKKYLAEIAALHNIEFVDATTPFKNSDLARYSLNIFDSHPNARANELFAEQLMTAIKKNNWFGLAAH